MFLFFALPLALLAHLTSSVELDLSSNAWYIESEISDRDLPDILKIISRPFREEVRRTQRIALNGTVPGYVLPDLHAAGIIAHPLRKDHDVTFRPLAKLTWTYRTILFIPGISTSSGPLLVFKGIDTVADIVINKVHYFRSANNQFKQLVLRLTPQHFTSDSLQVDVVIASPLDEADYRAQAYPHVVPPVQYPEVQHGEKYRNFLRKSPSSFSWDWGPAFLPAGIWSPVILVYNQDFYIESTHLKTQKTGVGSWKIDYSIKLICLCKKQARKIAFSLQSLTDKTLVSNYTSTTHYNAEKEIVAVNITEITAVGMWYPKGYGSQPLYVLTTHICSGRSEDHCVNASTTFGFRTVKLSQTSITNHLQNKTFHATEEPTEKQTTFEFVVNDVPVYIKGANLVPISVFQTARTDVRKLFDLVEFAGINALRVWGGGIYQPEQFYREADSRGILVWQEFMFACSLYPTNEQFLENVKQEVVEQTLRLSSHPSVVLFSGNNENKQGLQENWYNTNQEKELYVSEYMKLYDETIRRSIVDLITVPFLLSSPSNGEQAGWVDDNPQSQAAGDIHFYDYLNNCLDVRHLPIPRFASEFGFQSFPSLVTLRDAFQTKHVELFDRNTENRQHLVNGSNLLRSQIERMFGGVNNRTLKDHTLVYLTQLNQALCMAAEISHFRRHSDILLPDGRGMNTGVLFWQLNDVWAAPTWAVLDVNQRPKMLFYAVRSLYLPTIGTAHWNGTHLVLHVVREKRKPLKFGFDLFLYDVRDRLHLQEWGVAGYAGAGDPLTMEVYSISGQEIEQYCPGFRNCFVAVEFEVQSEGIRTVDVVRPGYDWAGMQFKQPTLTADVVGKYYDKAVVKITTLEIAMWVWLEAEELGTFSHNYFPMYRPEILVEFYPDIMTDDCCHVHVTSLYHHYN